MLEAFAFVLLALWLLAMGASVTMGGLIYLLPVLALGILTERTVHFWSPWLMLRWHANRIAHAA
ncbi:hypothetical protein [Methylovorus mays]|uniref:hypothetical protein n=1 Tax=Methylovorus mays TaxID=184077 RepID=UPI001E51FD0A|nr:hypothetical protein [Methylovorus mays]MCB5208151.1 hypothetical protein [Methylovorus mays]